MSPFLYESDYTGCACAYIFDSLKGPVQLSYFVPQLYCTGCAVCFGFSKKDSVIVFVNRTRLVTLYAFDSLKLTGLCESFVLELDYNAR